jgi:hypothetical protein
MIKAKHLHLKGSNLVTDRGRPILTMAPEDWEEEEGEDDE